MARHAERKTALVLHGARWLAVTDGRRSLGPVENKETGERIKSCTMIISDPNDFVGEVHDRMPLLLPDQFEHWLSGNMGVEELKLVSNDYLQRWAVSKRVNSSKADKGRLTHRAD
jgi:putative SOS response-associated peptidase YedK